MWHNSFVASTSDFWHHPVWKKSYGAVIANLMTKGYRFKNGLFLAVSNTTIKKCFKRNNEVDEFADVVKSTVPNTHRCQALLNFEEFDKPKTGNNIGEWLVEAHDTVGCKPNYITSHTVDGAFNATASQHTLEWVTSDERSQKMVAENCDAHKINTTAKQASGTSKHTTNLNPEMGASLHTLHLVIAKLCNYKACKDVLRNVSTEHERKKTLQIRQKMVTRWGSDYDEVECANINQHDVDTALKRIHAPGGVNEKLRIQDGDEEVANIPTAQDWNKYQQYEGAMAPMRVYSIAAQSAQVIAHEELFWGRATIEQLSAPFFLMKENLSKKLGSRGGADLTVRSLQCLHL